MVYGNRPPMAVDHGTAITINGKILLVGGRNSGQLIDKVFEYDPITDLWSEKSSMSIARSGEKFAYSKWKDLGDRR